MHVTKYDSAKDRDADPAIAARLAAFGEDRLKVVASLAELDAAVGAWMDASGA